MLFGTGTKGGVYRKKAWGCTSHTFLEVFFFSDLPLLIGFERADTEKSEETIATPPKGGFLPAPIAALSTMPLSAPGGRYRRYLSLREGSETGQIGAPPECPLFPLAK